MLQLLDIRRIVEEKKQKLSKKIELRKAIIIIMKFDELY